MARTCVAVGMAALLIAQAVSLPTHIVKSAAAPILPQPLKPTFRIHAPSSTDERRSMLQRQCAAKQRRESTLHLRGGGIGGGGWIPGGGHAASALGNMALGSWQLPTFGSGSSLWVPLGGIATLIVAGQLSDRLRGTTSQWSKLTAARVRDVFLYFGLSIFAWVAVGVVCWKTALVPTHPLHIFGLFIATIYATYKVSSLDYDRDRSQKVAWYTAFAGLQGVNLSAIMMQFYLRGMLHIMAQAAAITAADMAAVALVVASYPHKEWLWLRGAMAAGMGLLLGANLVNLMFGNRVFHAGIAYAGAAMFTIGLLSDAQRVIKEASQPPPPPGAVRVDSQGRSVADFDPIKHALKIYLDAVNLFFYILRILVDQEQRSQQQRSSSDDSRGRQAQAGNYRPPLRPGVGGPGLRSGGPILRGAPF